jgi:hypothetical protein
MAIGLIVCGVILIIAGLGYTISRTSGDSPSNRGDPAGIRHLEAFDEPKTIWHPLAHRGDKRVFTAVAKEESRRDVQTGAYRESNLVYPALTLLSGVIIAVVGALSLLHRWHVRGVRLSG